MRRVIGSAGKPAVVAISWIWSALRFVIDDDELALAGLTWSRSTNRFLLSHV